MSGNWDGSITLVWGGEVRRFRLAFGELAALESARDLGSFEILKRLANKQARVFEVRDVLRYGLEGGGLSPTQAVGLVKRYCEGRPLSESFEPAFYALSAALYEIPEELADSGKDEGEGAETSDQTASPSL